MGQRVREKVGFSAVFSDIIRRKALPNESSIHTAEITAMKTKLKGKTKEILCCSLNTTKISHY